MSRGTQINKFIKITKCFFLNFFWLKFWQLMKKNFNDDENKQVKNYKKNLNA